MSSLPKLVDRPLHPPAVQLTKAITGQTCQCSGPYILSTNCRIATAMTLCAAAGAIPLRAAHGRQALDGHARRPAHTPSVARYVLFDLSRCRRFRRGEGHSGCFDESSSVGAAGNSVCVVSYRGRVREVRTELVERRVLASKLRPVPCGRTARWTSRALSAPRALRTRARGGRVDAVLAAGTSLGRGLQSHQLHGGCQLDVFVDGCTVTLRASPPVGCGPDWQMPPLTMHWGFVNGLADQGPWRVLERPPLGTAPPIRTLIFTFCWG